MYFAKFDKLPGKADATLLVSHVFVTLEAIIHDSPVSHGAIPAPDQFGGSNCSAQCFEAWLLVYIPSYYIYNVIV